MDLNYNRDRLQRELNRGYIAPLFPDGLTLDGIPAIDRGSFFEFNCPDANFLLKALDIEAGMYKLPASSNTRIFLFRGHRDAAWKLEPSVYRLPNTPSPEQKKIQQSRIRAVFGGGAMDHELTPFYQFLEGINDLGMYIDDGSLDIMDDRRARARREEAALSLDPIVYSEPNFPTREQLRTLALAQHYGLPTRLLDWTTNPYVALFFAVEGIHRTSADQAEKEFGIWVIPRILPELVKLFKYVEIVEVPKFQNSNIIAQQGIFTSHIPTSSDVTDRGAHPPYNQNRTNFLTFDQYLTDHNDDELFQQVLETIKKPFLFKLKYCEIAPIRRKLDQLNISWATMMPNLEGVTKEATRRYEMVPIRD